VRLISFFLTAPQFLDGSKDVTRRIGWWSLKRGDRLMAVRKSQGRKPGEPIQRMGEIEVVNVRTEILSEISQDEVRREGFPRMERREFVEMFCDAMGCDPTAVVNRIQFRRIT